MWNDVTQCTTLNGNCQYMNMNFLSIIKKLVSTFQCFKFFLKLILLNLASNHAQDNYEVMESPQFDYIIIGG